MNLEAFARAISESDHTPHDGDCFPAAFHMAIRMVTRLPFAPSEIRVVHGWPILPSRPEVRHAHAWVEVGAVVIDGSNGNWEKPLVATTARVYPIGRLEPRHVVRYTMAEVIHRTIDARHYGPFDDNTPPPNAVEVPPPTAPAVPVDPDPA